MSKWNESDYLAHWPMAIPFPYSVKRSTRPVPNSTAVNWPQSQFAPLYRPPGSPSFDPYSYVQNDVPLYMREPVYSTQNMYPYAQSGVGPGGDTSKLPDDFGDPMSHRHTHKAARPAKHLHRHGREMHAGVDHKDAVRRAKQKAARKIAMGAGATGLRLTPTQIELIRIRTMIHALRRQPKSIKVDRQIRALSARYVKVLRRRRQEVQYVANRGAVRPVATRMNTVRIGMRSTGVPIASGVPSHDNGSAPASILTPDRHDLGDGFAYELAPLQASAPYGDMGGDCGCGCGGAGDCAKNNEGLGTGTLVAAGLGGMLALAAIPTFLVNPWIVKQFKPEWSYGKRVATGMIGSFVVINLMRMGASSAA